MVRVSAASDVTKKGLAQRSKRAGYDQMAMQSVPHQSGRMHMHESSRCTSPGRDEGSLPAVLRVSRTWSRTVDAICSFFLAQSTCASHESAGRSRAARVATRDNTGGGGGDCDDDNSDNDDDDTDGEINTPGGAHLIVQLQQPCGVPGQGFLSRSSNQMMAAVTGHGPARKQSRPGSTAKARTNNALAAIGYGSTTS